MRWKQEVACIDYIIMRQARSYDVTLLRSVDCCTDHKLLRAQLRVQAPTTKAAKLSFTKRFVVSALHSEVNQQGILRQYRKKLVNFDKKEATGLQKWEAIRDSLLNAAKVALGHANETSLTGPGRIKHPTKAHWQAQPLL